MDGPKQFPANARGPTWVLGLLPFLLPSSRAFPSPPDLYPRSGSMVGYPSASPRVGNWACSSLRMGWEAPFSRGPQYRPTNQRIQIFSLSTSVPTDPSTQD